MHMKHLAALGFFPSSMTPLEKHRKQMLAAVIKVVMWKLDKRRSRMPPSTTVVFDKHDSGHQRHRTVTLSPGRLSLRALTHTGTVTNVDRLLQ
jgi:hypothetical protein